MHTWTLSDASCRARSSRWWRALALAVTATLMISPAVLAQLCTETETWVPAAMPGSGNISIAAMTAQPDGLYALMVATRNVSVARWDGTSWTTVVPWTRGEFSFPKLTMYKGDLYSGTVAMLNDSAHKMGREDRPLRWDGTAWRMLPKLGGAPALDISVHALLGSTDGLFCGYRQVDTTVLTCRIARFDGTKWALVHTGPDWGAIALVQHNGAMHALATSHGPLATGGDSLAAIMRWDGSKFRVVVDSIPGRLSWPLSDGGNLYFCVGHGHTTRTEMMRWDGRSLVTLPRYAITYFKHAALFNGEPYVFGNDSTGADVVFRYDGTTWRPVSTIWSGASTLEYNGQFYAGGWLMPGCVPYASSFVRLCRQPECGMISGRVYNDADGNCARSQGEAGLADRVISIAPAGYTVRTDAGGDFRQLVPAGLYTLALKPRDYWRHGCGNGALTVNVAAGGNSDGNDFAMTAEPGVHDGIVTLTGDRARPGTMLRITMRLDNLGTAADSGCTLRLRSIPPLAAGKIPFAATKNEPGLIEANVYALPPENPFNLNLDLVVPPDAKPESSIRLIADLDVHGERDDANNHDTILIPVRTSHDPNEIVVTPGGTAPDGTITRGDSVLVYTIHFQNTGSDTAFQVAIADTLDPSIDPASLVMRGSSHRYSLEQHERGELLWRFHNIKLPDSTSNQQNSHGYLSYTVHLKSGLPAGTRIANKGAIIFDYNAPVVTNTVVNTIAQPSAVDGRDAPPTLTVVPNPAHDRAVIYLGGSGGTVELRTLLGARVRRVETEQAHATLDLTGLPAGVYLISTTQRSGARTEGRLVVER